MKSKAMQRAQYRALIRRWLRAAEEAITKEIGIACNTIKLTFPGVL